MKGVVIPHGELYQVSTFSLRYPEDEADWLQRNDISLPNCILFIPNNTEWPKKMYTLFTHQYLWNKFK